MEKENKEKAQHGYQWKVFKLGAFKLLQSW
jgi:hypothetical protein